MSWKYNSTYDAITNGNNKPICGDVTSYRFSTNYYTDIPNPTAGWFYFIKINNLWIADRPVITYVTYDELENAGYINGRYRMLSYEEYGQTISTIPDPLLWNNIPSYNSLGNYKGAYGEWTSTVRMSDDKVFCISNLKQETSGDYICSGDYYHIQYANKYNSKSVRNFLNGGDNGIVQYMPAVYRPVMGMMNKVYNNLELSE